MLVLTNVRLFTGGADLTGQSNSVDVSAEVEERDASHFDSGGWKEVLGGLSQADLSGSGHWQAGDPGAVDNQAWSLLGGVGAWTVAPDTATAGQLAYVTQVLTASYQLGGSVGDVAPWSLSGRSAWPLVRGLVAHPPGTARTSTGAAAGHQLGAVASGERLYASLHVLSASGDTPSLTVEIESDDSDAFAAPVTRLSFAAADSPGGQILRTNGDAISDDWFRVAWTISGDDPSFMFLVALGVH